MAWLWVERMWWGIRDRPIPSAKQWTKAGSPQRVFIGAEMSSSAWDRAVRLALRTPYVVQERFSCGSQLFPVYQYGELQMKQAEVSVHPHVLNGKVHGVSAALEVSTAGCSTPLAIAPVLLLEPI
jgi:hypothetical protein